LGQHFSIRPFALALRQRDPPVLPAEHRLPRSCQSRRERNRLASDGA
jgi:hypothetical protein